MLEFYELQGFFLETRKINGKNCLAIFFLATLELLKVNSSWIFGIRKEEKHLLSTERFPVVNEFFLLS